MTTFADLGVRPDLADRLRELNIEIPTPVQAQAIPPLREGRDIVVQAPTGSGKTHAFLLPAIERLRAGRGLGTRVLVLTPTRELALQVESVFAELESGIPCAVLYGGVGYHTQDRKLAEGAEVVVGTPGRILDMVERRKVSLARVEYLVLDEADEMLDIGFAPQVEKILGFTWHPQTVLASATMPDWVRRMVHDHLHDPVQVQVTADPDEATLEHARVIVDERQRLEVLIAALRATNGSTLVFGRTKSGVNQLTRDLNRRRIRASQLQGDMRQIERDRVMASFRDGTVRILVATNVAARGLDVSQVDLVVNYELPDSREALTHRIGRTARAGRAGRALTITSHADAERWRRLQAPQLPLLNVDDLLRGEWSYAGAAADSTQRDSSPLGGELARRAGGAVASTDGGSTNAARRPGGDQRRRRRRRRPQAAA